VIYKVESKLGGEHELDNHIFAFQFAPWQHPFAIISRYTYILRLISLLIAFVNYTRIHDHLAEGDIQDGHQISWLEPPKGIFLEENQMDEHSMASSPEFAVYLACQLPCRVIKNGLFEEVDLSEHAEVAREYLTPLAPGTTVPWFLDWPRWEDAPGPLPGTEDRESY